MKHEKILTIEDGTRYKILVSLRIDFKPIYNILVFSKEKRKRTWFNVVDVYSYESLRLSIAERVVAFDKEVLKFVTEEEILSAKLELWELIKP